MSLSDMQVFNEFVMPATIVSMDQKIDAFNAASGGAIILQSEGMTGDFMQESFFASLAAADRDVDRYAANADVSATPLTELLRNSVKAAGGFGPVSYEPSQLTWLRRPTQEGIAAAAEAFSEILMQKKLNTAISALVGAIGNNAATTHDATGTPFSYTVLNGAHAKFGDASMNLVTDVMHGKAYHKLVGDNLTNAERLFTAGNVRVVDLLGKITIVTDAPALIDGTLSYKSLSLVNGACVVGGNEDVITNIETNNGKQRIETTIQSDYTHTFGIKGYSWDTVNGGKSPLTAELGTGSNWDKVAQFDKLTAGVLAIGDQ